MEIYSCVGNPSNTRYAIKTEKENDSCIYLPFLPHIYIVNLKYQVLRLQRY